MPASDRDTRTFRHPLAAPFGGLALGVWLAGTAFAQTAGTDRVPSAATARTTRNATPHASASESAPSHVSPDVVAAPEVSASSSGIAPVAENYLMGSTGFEPVTSTV